MIKSKCRNLRFVKRANDPYKTLSERAIMLATAYYNLISSYNGEGIVVYPDWIRNITGVLHEQNRLIHHELRDLFNIQYHRSIKIEGKESRRVFVITLTENIEEILENPKKFYSSVKSSDSKVCELKHEQSFEMAISDNDIVHSLNNIAVSDTTLFEGLLKNIKLLLQVILERKDESKN